MICLPISLRTALLIPLFILGASPTVEWKVNYNQHKICALKGSTVSMNANYSHPKGLKEIKTFWILASDTEKTDLQTISNYSGRVEYLPDQQKHFNLKLSNVTKKDEHAYAFRITTNVDEQKWVGCPGVTLSVTDLQVESPEEVTERETAVLTCKTTCNLTDPTFIWYKNGLNLTTKTIQKNQLHLQTVSSEDAGSYSCALREHEHLRSPAQTLSVRYPPKNISVSINETSENSSVTLTCNSDANPPVQNYTWFKEGGSSPVGSGHSYCALQSGSFYCVAQNKYGSQTSAVVKVSIRGSPYVVPYAAAGVGCGVFVIGFVSSYLIRKNRKVKLKKTENVSDIDVFTNIEATSGAHNASLHNSPSQEAVYANVLYWRNAEGSSEKTSPSGSTVDDESHKDDVQYASIMFHHSSPANKFDDERVDEMSAIYSSVK